MSCGGIIGDTPLTQFAGGTVVDRVSAEDPFVGLAGLRLLPLFLEDTEYYGLVKQALSLLQQTLPEVPYYLQQFFKLTAVEIYNRFVLQGVPLEYVKMSPDVHVPQMYFGFISIRPEGIEELYKEAS